MGTLSSNLQIKLRESILKHNLQDASRLILDSAVECWALAMNEPEDFSAIGNCRIGGDPDLPPSVEWPRTNDGLFLNFILQLNLAEMPPIADNPLPGHGMLYFFVESDESSTDVVSRLLYFDGDVSLLKRVATPDYDQLAHENYVDLEPHKLVPIVIADLPECGSETCRMVEKVSKTTEIDTPAERYCSLIESITTGDGEMHIVCKLLGHMPEIEGDMRWNACLHKAGRNILIPNYNKSMDEVESLLSKAEQENESLEIEYYREVKESLSWFQLHYEQLRAARLEWRQLLMIDSNRSVDLSIWHTGSFNILIRDEDLRNRDFSNVYVEIANG